MQRFVLGVCVSLYKVWEGSECSCFDAQWTGVSEVIRWKSHPAMSRVTVLGLYTVTRLCVFIPQSPSSVPQMK